MLEKNTLNTNRAKILRMTQVALLAALEIILTLLYISVGTININFGLVPIIIAAVCLSPWHGALIGAVSGFVTMFQVLTGQGAFYVFLMSYNPLVACILCVAKTTAAGLIICLVYKWIAGGGKRKTVASVVASVLCPIINTGIFALGMLTVFGNGLLADPTFSALSPDLFVIVFVFLIGANFFVELAVSLAVGPVITRTLLNTKFFKK